MPHFSRISVLFVILAISRQVEDGTYNCPITESSEFFICSKLPDKTQHVIQIPSSFIMHIMSYFSNWQASLWWGKATDFVNLVSAAPKFHIFCSVICPAKSATPNLCLESTSNSHKQIIAWYLNCSLFFFFKKKGLQLYSLYGFRHYSFIMSLARHCFSFSTFL